MTDEFHTQGELLECLEGVIDVLNTKTEHVRSHEPEPEPEGKSEGGPAQLDPDCPVVRTLRRNNRSLRVLIDRVRRIIREIQD